MSTHASHTIHLNLSLESAWKFLSDLSLAPYYVPGLTGCWFHPGPQSGRGASRRVQRRYGQWLDETVVDWQEGSGFVLHLHKANRGAPAGQYLRQNGAANRRKPHGLLRDGRDTESRLH